jgi:hypothetical protein
MEWDLKALCSTKHALKHTTQEAPPEWAFVLELLREAVTGRDLHVSKTETPKSESNGQEVFCKQCQINFCKQC